MEWDLTWQAGRAGELNSEAQDSLPTQSKHTASQVDPMHYIKYTSAMRFVDNSVISFIVLIVRHLVAHTGDLARVERVLTVDKQVLALLELGA